MMEYVASSVYQQNRTTHQGKQTAGPESKSVTPGLTVDGTEIFEICEY